MIVCISGLPDHAVGFSAQGQVTGEDYEQVMIPAIEAVLERSDRVNVLYHLGPAFAGFDGKALWDDARLGLSHFGAWNRIAVVTDTDWLAYAARAVGLAMPGRVRVFPDDELDAAKAWIAEPSGPALALVLHEDAALLELEPHGPLEEEDFERVDEVVEEYAKREGPLRGLLVRADSFPGWRSFSGLLAHMKFVREQQDVLKRVAVVSDGFVLSRLPLLVKHFVGAEVKHFPARDEELARAWAAAGAGDADGDRDAD